LLPSGAFSDGTTADAFETGLLTDWSKVTNNGAQLAETATRGTLLESFTYYKAIRADQKSCVICHTDPASISPMKIGHIIAIAKTIYGN